MEKELEQKLEDQRREADEEKYNHESENIEENEFYN